MELDGNTLIAPPPFVEVELVYEPARPGMTRQSWCALQIFTRNRRYDVDWGMRCFAVTELESGESNPKNRLIGALLSGGQKYGAEGLELTFPVPRPGVAAVFEVGEPPKTDFVTTSEVERVVLRLRVLALGLDESETSGRARNTWSELSGSFRGTRLGHGDPGPR